MGLVVGFEGKTAATLTPSAPQPEQVQEQVTSAQLRSQLQAAEAQLAEARAELQRLKAARPAAALPVARVDEVAAREIASLKADVEEQRRKAAALEQELAGAQSRINARGIEIENLMQSLAEQAPTIARLTQERDAAIRERDEARKGGKRR